MCNTDCSITALDSPCAIQQKDAADMSSQHTSASYDYYCETEKDCWRVLVRSCDLRREDIDILINKMEYSTMRRLSMFGLHKNPQSLLNAGLSDAKANMIIVFATYVLHQPKRTTAFKDRPSTKKTTCCIPKKLTFDDIMDFNLSLLHPHQRRNQPQQMPMGAHAAQQPPPLRPFVAHSPTLPPIAMNRDVKEPSEIDTGSRSVHSGSRTSKGSKQSKRSQEENSATNRRANRRLVNRNKTANQMENQSMKTEDNSFQPATEMLPTKSMRKSQSFESATTAKTHMSTSSRWGDESQTKVVVLDQNSTYPAVVVEEDEEEVPPPPVLTSAASGATMESARSKSPMQKPTRKPSLGAGGELSKTASSTASNKNDTIPNKPPRYPVTRASMAWSIALDAYGVHEDLTDSEFEDDSDDDDSDDTDSDSDDSGSDSDEDTDAESDDEEEELKKMQSIKRKLAAKSREAPAGNAQTVSWKTRNVTTHEWTLPANKVLPVSLQSLFREAAQNPEVDIQQRLQEALSGSTGGPPPTD